MTELSSMLSSVHLFAASSSSSSSGAVSPTPGVATTSSSSKRLSPRLTMRPPPITIPAVKIHNARLQEIELLGGENE